MEYVDKLTAPLKVGELYMVPCIVIQKEKYVLNPNPDNWLLNEDEEWVAGEEEILQIEYQVFPVINHLHHDKENGQAYKHYHGDSRFEAIKGSNIKVLYQQRQNQVDENTKLEYIVLRCAKIHMGKGTPTNVGFIAKSKLKHKCIHKGKCPHRGYDLSNELPDEHGLITCPLHSLAFDAVTKELMVKSFNELEVNKKFYFGSDFTKTVYTKLSETEWSVHEGFTGYTNIEGLVIQVGK